MCEAVTFIIADNQDITRVGLGWYVQQVAHGAPICEVCDKKGLLSALMKCDGDAVVVLDYVLSDIRSDAELLVIGKRFPRSRWIIFSNELSEDFIRRLSAEQSVSLLLKDSSDEEIRAALKCALNGERFLCHRVANLLLAGVRARSGMETPLTSAETEVLKLIALGKSAKEIAVARNSSVHTVITHKKNIFRKLEVNNVHEATKYALRAGLVEMVEYYI
ncbi:MAG: response regulator transcription factor [Muribaculaceae bacterium]|nr:response regulator transcription factor [Muribaculaceae bacterium]